MSWGLWSPVLGRTAGLHCSVTAMPLPDGDQALFVVSSSAEVFSTFGNHVQGWAPWTSISEGTGGPGTRLAAVSNGGSRFTLFTADPGGGVFTATGSPIDGWGPWSTVRQGHAGPGTSVTAVRLNTGEIGVFLADPGGGVFATSGSGTTWDPWRPVSNGLAEIGSTIAAVALKRSMGRGRVALFAVRPGGEVINTTGSPQDNDWEQWTSVREGSAGPGTSVTAVSPDGEHVALFVADPGGGVFTTLGIPSGDWQNWTTVNEGVAQPGTSVTPVLTSDRPDARVGVFISEPHGGVLATLGVPGKWTPWTSVADGNAGPGTNVAAVSLGGTRFGVFVADRGAGIFANSGDPERANFTHPVRHVFLLMLENRSFDHMLGFSDISGTDAATGQPTHIEGLKGDETNRTEEGIPVRVTTAAPDSLSTDPGHSFSDTLEQLCGGPRLTPADPRLSGYPKPFNQGFVVNYAKHGGVVENVMRCFAPEHLPVLNALAREFAVCDHWFSAMPGPTEPNRYISLTGGCGRFDEAPSDLLIFLAEAPPEALPGGFRFRNGTNLFETLHRFGVEGRIYKRGQTTVANELAGSPRAVSIDKFRGDLEDSDFDGVGFVLIEPNYDALGDFRDGDSQHPSGSVARGERLIKEVYETIRRSRVWERSLLIITWDEHGGFYDHVPPPGPNNPPAPRKTGDLGSTHGFVFDQLGVRVPAVVVSPLIPRNVIEHRIFDHTAIAATVRRIFKLPQFDERDGISGGVDHLATLPAARADTPLVLPNALEPVPPLSSPLVNPNAPLFTEGGSLVAAGIHSVLVQHLQVLPVEQRAATIARVRNLKTRGEAIAYVNEATQLLRSHGA